MKGFEQQDAQDLGPEESLKLLHDEEIESLKQDLALEQADNYELREKVKVMVRKKNLFVTERKSFNTLLF